jgi:peptidyl-prolyl cis-trans isomerase A (cyclophilin A)
MKRLGWICASVAFVFACQQQHKTDEPAPAGHADNGPAGSAAKPTGNELPAEPVGKAPPPQPSPNPAPMGDAVAPPAAADLAGYIKDLKGNGPLTATFDTSQGTIHCELFGDKTPMTVANFVGLATGKKPWLNPKTGGVQRDTPFFDGITFHRVIPGFMIQGGDPLGQGIGGPGYQFNDEFVDGLQMGPGALAMANAGPGTNGSQFFIMAGSRPDLVHHHTIFGQCKELDVVKKITGVKTTEDKPNEPVVINKLTISRG